MTGYDNGKYQIVVCYMPTRKKPCLAVRKGHCVVKYATFNDEESAKEFLDIFADFIGVPKTDWDTATI